MIDPISFVLRDYVRIRTTELILQNNYANKLQQYELLHLIVRARNTRFGKAHKFSTIRSVKGFQKQVPIAHYDDLKDDIREMMLGKANILWPGKIKYFTKSSATTANSKYIPVSKSALSRCHYKGGKDMVAFYLRSNENTKLFSGKVLSLCGSLQSFPENIDIEVGDVSAILTKNLPLVAQMFRFPEPLLALKNDWEKKIEEISDIAIKENITGLIGVPMWILVFIKKVLEKSGKKSIFEVWPNLEVFMHGGISFKPYREIFDELLAGKDIKYIESYNASEGYFAIQDDLNKPNEMRLMLDYGVFYEFIPLKLYEQGIYEAKTIKDIELEINYVLVITTNSGLWRYVIGDTVIFTSIDPYRIKITGRTKQYLNLYDEEITVENVECAISYACKESKSQVSNFTMCPSLPDKHGRGNHEWIVEFIKEPNNKNLFSKLVDEFLIKENGDYASRRSKDIVLQKPIFHFVSQKTFYNWMKSKNRLGGQFKVPRISNSRDMVESILDFIHKL